jgi:hypothetical protein
MPPLHPWSAEIGGSLTCRSPCLSALIRFERRPEAAPVRLPKMAEGCELESHTREGASRFPSGAGAPARLAFQIGGERAQSKPMPFPAPSVFKTAPATWPVHSPCWSSRQESNLHPSPSEGGAHPIELRDVSVLDLAVPVEIVEPALVQIVRRERPLRRDQIVRRGLFWQSQRTHVEAV